MLQNLKKDSPHKRDTPKKPASNQNLKRHISEIDESEKKKSVFLGGFSNAGANIDLL
jgi:hypothetical protein